MAVDRHERDELAAAIRSYMRCEIDNHRFDELIAERYWNDPLCQALALALWVFYDDLSEHHFDRLGYENAGPFMQRWEALLRTDLDFDEPARRKELADSGLCSPGFWGGLRDLFFGFRPGFFTKPWWPLPSPEAWEELGVPYVSPTPRPE